MEKKSYSKPQLIVHGDVETITQNASSGGADSPAGIANTGFPIVTPGS